MASPPRTERSPVGFAWWLVLCLIGLDYFSTLAYVPSLAVQAVTGAAPGGPQAKSKLEELVGGLTVVGINRGRVPEALIEDAKATRTYFVKIGDDLNGLKVKAIDQNGVTVTYEGEETTLK